ncbi:IclR family transcriptional regulator [Mycolicibacterium sp.]|uniref:IclR family transcriptional regulator n=1 Tax=Mycolicibacterium sp. TaxID=2320850 RepID=UPI0025ED79D7|nr:IclR family transcriptional regulator [Mycolicibacterium sp.]
MSIEVENCPPSAVLGRASLVLGTFDGPGRQNFTQIVRRTGLPRTSVHRILEHLVELGWLRRSGRDYELGFRLAELGYLAIHQDRLHRAATPFLWDLHQATGHVVNLAILDGPDVVHLGAVGDRAAVTATSSAGRRHPAHSSAMGRAMLAYAPAGRLAALEAGTSGALREELALVRARGFSESRDETSTRITCLAAPIGRGAEICAAVSISGASGRMASDHRLAALLQMTAARIWRAYSGRPAGIRRLQAAR